MTNHITFMTFFDKYILDTFNCDDQFKEFCILGFDEFNSKISKNATIFTYGMIYPKCERTASFFVVLLNTLQNINLKSKSSISIINKTRAGKIWDKNWKEILTFFEQRFCKPHHPQVMYQLNDKQQNNSEKIEKLAEEIDNLKNENMELKGIIKKYIEK